jgi:hypothetical protein
MKEKEIKGSQGIESVSRNYLKGEEKTELTEEQKIEDERRALGPKNYSRKMRREQLKGAGILKMKNNLRFGTPEWVEWYEKTRTEGKRLHVENTEAVEKQKEWYLERFDEKNREHLTEFYINCGWLKPKIKNKINSIMDLWYTVVIDKKENLRKKDAETKNN